MLIWTLLVLLLPIGLVMSIAVLPKKFDSPWVVNAPDVAFRTTLATENNEWLSVSIKSQENTKDKQLEIVLKKPLQIPSAYVYFQQTIVGVLGAKGLYRFPIDSALAGQGNYLVEIRNPIDKTLFQEIALQP